MQDKDIQDLLTEKTKKCFDLANQKLSRSYGYPRVDFDLRGTTAGVAYTLSNIIKYNLGIAKENLEHFLNTTVPHEVAHIIADRYFGVRCVHGQKWKMIMRNVFNLEPKRCHSYNVQNHRVRKTKLYLYPCACSCGCKVGAKHHNMIQKKVGFFTCRRCRSKLVPSVLVKCIDKSSVMV
jgi:SprT protein